MFELDDFDLDDEVFLSTQMPTVISRSPAKTSSSDCVALNFEDKDKIFLSVSDSQNNIKLKNESPQKYNKNNSDLQNGIIHNNMLITEHKSEIKNTVNECQSNKNKLNFDDCFDSDDEAFFSTPDILYEPINSTKTACTIELNLHNNYNECASSFSSENHELLSESFNIKSPNQSDCNSHLNTTVTSVKTMSPKCTSRRFPGPAGLLSENENVYSEDASNLESLDMSINITENDKNDENLCTQANDSSFSSSPYQQFLSDFINTSVDVLLDKYNVAWIKQKLLPYTASGRFFTDKIPFFVSVIKEIDCLSPDPTVLLADKTGHIRGTIHRAVWNQFSSQLKLGAVLVLSKVGVSCQKIVKGFTLNITSDHLVAIYSFSCEDMKEVIVTRTTDLTNEEIVNDAKRWNVFNVETFSKNPHSEIRSRITALNNLKLHNISLDQNSRLSNVNYQNVNNIPAQSTPVKSFFKLKTPVAHNLLKNNDSCNFHEEPPAKRIRNEECELKTEEKDSNHEMSIVQNIFEGIDENEMFDEFYC